MNGLAPLSRNAVDLFKRQYQQTYLPYDNKRSNVDRFFDVLNVGNYVSAGIARGMVRDDMSVAEGIWSGLKAANPFGSGYEKGEHQYSQVFEDMGWKPTSFVGKAARGVLGFIGDVMLDPMTYISSGTSAIVRGTGKAGIKASHTSAKLAQELAEHGVKDVAEGLTKEAAKSIIIKSGANIADDVLEESAEKLVTKFNKALGLREAHQGINISLANAPFGEKIFGKYAQKSHQLVSGEVLQELGEKTLAPAYANIRDRVYGGKVGKLFANKSALYNLSKENPVQFWNTLRAVEITRGINKSKQAFIKAIHQNAEIFKSLTPAEREEFLSIIEDKEVWSKVQKLAKFSQTEDAINVRAKLENIYSKMEKDLGEVLENKRFLSSEEVKHAAELTNKQEELKVLAEKNRLDLINLDVKYIRDKGQLDELIAALRDERAKLNDIPTDDVIEYVEEKVQKTRQVKDVVDEVVEKTRVVDELVPVRVSDLTPEERVKHFVTKYKEEVKVRDEFIQQRNAARASKAKPLTAKEKLLDQEARLAARDSEPVVNKIKIVEEINDYLYGNSKSRMIASTCRQEQLDSLIELIQQGKSKRVLEAYIEENANAFSWWANEVYPYVGSKIGYGSGKQFKTWHEMREAMLKEIRFDEKNLPLTSKDAEKLLKLEQLELKRADMIDKLRYSSVDEMKEIKRQVDELELYDDVRGADVRVKKGFADAAEERRARMIDEDAAIDEASNPNTPSIKSRKTGEFTEKRPMLTEGDLKQLKGDLFDHLDITDNSADMELLRLQIDEIVSKGDTAGEANKLRRKLNYQNKNIEEQLKWVEQVENEVKELLRVKRLNTPYYKMSDKQKKFLYNMAVEDAKARRVMGITGEKQVLNSDMLKPVKAVTASIDKHIKNLQEKADIIKRYTTSTDEATHSVLQSYKKKIKQAKQKRADILADYGKAVKNVWNKDELQAAAKKIIDERVANAYREELMTKLQNGFEIHFKSDSNVKRGVITSLEVTPDNKYKIFAETRDGIVELNLDDVRFIKTDAKLMEVDDFIRHSRTTGEFVARQEEVDEIVDYIKKQREEVYDEVVKKEILRDETYEEVIKKPIISSKKVPDDVLKKKERLASKLDFATKKLDDVSKSYEATKEAIQDSFIKRSDVVKKRITDLEVKTQILREELANIDEANIIKLTEDIKIYQEAFANDDAFETLVRVKYGDNFVEGAIQNASPDVEEILLNPDVQVSDKVRELAQKLRSTFNEIGKSEVAIGKLQQEQLENMALWYFPHILDEGGQKLFGSTEEILRKFPNWGDNAGFGLGWNPHAKARTIKRVPKTINEATGQVLEWIENPSVREVNEAMRLVYGDKLKGKNVFSEDIAKVYLSRALTNLDLLYDNQYMHEMLDIFGDDYQGAIEGFASVMNFGKFRETTSDFVGLSLSLEIGEQVSEHLNSRELQERIHNQAVEILTKKGLEPSGYALKRTKANLISEDINKFMAVNFGDDARKKLSGKLLDDFINVSSTHGLLDDLATPMLKLDDNQIQAITNQTRSVQDRFLGGIKKSVISYEKQRYFEWYAAGVPDELLEKINKMDVADLRTYIEDSIDAAYKYGDDVDVERLERVMKKTDRLEKISPLQIKNVNNTIVERVNQARNFQIAKDQSRFLQLYDKFTHLIKLNQTTVLPSFHIRNKFSNVFNNWLEIGADAFNMDFQKKSWEVVKNAGDVEGALKVVAKDGTVSAMKWNEIYLLAEEYGVIDKGYYAADLGVDKVGKGVLGKVGVPGKLDPTDTKNFFGYQAGAKFGNAVENQDRMIHFASQLSRGMGVEEAAESVNKFLFDYSDLTAFEQNVMKRIIPYYTWLRKNAPLQLEQMLEKPEKYRFVGKVLNSVEGMVDEEDKINKAFVNDFALDWIQTPFNVLNPQGRTEPVLWNPNLPYGDISRIPNPLQPVDALKGIFTQMNPLIKTPAELLMNRNVFFDSPIVNDNDNAFKKRAEHVLSQFAMFGVVKDFAEKDGADLGLHALNTFGGVKLLSYDYDAYKAVKIKEMLERANRPATGLDEIDAAIRHVFNGKTLMRGVKTAVSLAGEIVHESAESLADMSTTSMPLRPDEYKGALRPISQAKYQTLSSKEKALYTPPNKETAMAYHKKAVALSEAAFKETGKTKQFLWTVFDNLNLGQRNKAYEFGKVVRVIDGDTLEVQIGDEVKTIRMLLIDTPESAGTYEDNPMPYGKEASTYMNDYVFGEDVRIVFDGDEKDKYGRTLGYVEVDGVDINKQMLAEGYARTAYVMNPPYDRLNQYQTTERKAQQSKQKIWSTPNYATANGFDMGAIERALEKKRSDIQTFHRGW